MNPSHVIYSQNTSRRCHAEISDHLHQNKAQTEQMQSRNKKKLVSKCGNLDKLPFKAEGGDS